MALDAFHQWRIAFDARINSTDYHQQTFVSQQFPPTRWRAHEAARAAIQPYIDSRRMLRRLRVTGISRSA